MNNLPNEIKYIMFQNNDLTNMSKFNQEIDQLPESLIGLLLRYTMFNKEIQKLPSLLEYLSLPYDYNLRIKCLPKGIKDIEIGYYTQIEEYPDDVDRLNLINDGKILRNVQKNFNVNKLPKNLKVLEIEDCSKCILECKLPDTLLYYNGDKTYE